MPRPAPVITATRPDSILKGAVTAPHDWAPTLTPRASGQLPRESSHSLVILQILAVHQSPATTAVTDAPFLAPAGHAVTDAPFLHS